MPAKSNDRPDPADAPRPMHAPDPSTVEVDDDHVAANTIDGATVEAPPPSETNDPRYQDTGPDDEGMTRAQREAAESGHARRASDREDDT